MAIYKYRLLNKSGVVVGMSDSYENILCEAEKLLETTLTELYVVKTVEKVELVPSPRLKVTEIK